MNKKTTYAIVAVVIVIVIVGVAAYALLYNNGGGTNTTPTPTPSPSVSTSSTLQFNSNLTTQGSTLEHKWAGKNIHTGNLIVRVDILGGESGNYSYILDTGQNKSWVSVNGGSWTASDFAADWSGLGAEWTDYLNHMANWSSGDITYQTQTGETVLLYNIVVNPTISDSTFETT